MNRKNHFILVVLTFLLLAGCGKQTIPTDTISPLTIPQPTLTATQPRPTATPKPTETATEIPSITPSTPLFPVFSPDWSSHDTPTPIATPIPKGNNFQLTEWNEEKAISLVHLMEQYAYARDIPGLSENRFMFQADQIHTKLAVQEALFRYPDSVYQQELLWKLANINAVMNNNASDEWIISMLEDGLNKGQYSPADLETVLNEYGFEIDEEYTIPNLFGDGAEVKVFVINTQHRHTTDGLLVALREILPETYDLILMESGWSFHWGVLEIDSYRDLNENGLPEIFAYLKIIATSSDRCYIYILEWQEDHFSVLTETGAPISSGRSCEFQIKYSSDQDLNHELMVSKRVYSSFTEKYVWNGQYYELIDTEYYAIIESLYDNFRDQDYKWAAEEIENYLQGTSPIKVFSRWSDVEKGPAKDFLRFVLGLAYAYQSDVNHAREIFLDLAQSPTDSDYPYISQAAQAFISKYYDDADIYISCSAAIEVIDAARGYVDKTSAPDDEIIGLSDDFQDDIDNYCSGWNTAPISKMIELIKPSAATSLPVIMNNAGVTGLIYAPFDLWLDGERDWVIIADLPDGNGSASFLAVQYQEQWIGLFLDSYLWQLPAWVNVEQINLPGLEHPVVLARTDEDFYIFDVEIKGDEISLRLLLSPLGKEYFLVNTDRIPEVLTFSYYEQSYYVEGVPDEVSYEWESFYWDENQSEFIEGMAAEYFILEQNQYEDAIAIIKLDLQTIRPYYQQAKSAGKIGYDYFTDTVSLARSRLLYLLGLAYELNGDETLAVQTYYQLWREHPDSPYALMARAKLEPVVP